MNERKISPTPGSGIFMRRRWEAEVRQNRPLEPGGHEEHAQKFAGDLHETPLRCASRGEWSLSVMSSIVKNVNYVN